MAGTPGPLHSERGLLRGAFLAAGWLFFVLCLAAVVAIVVNVALLHGCEPNVKVKEMLSQLVDVLQ